MRPSPPARAALHGTVATPVCLGGAIVPAFAATGLVNRFLPGFAERAGPALFYAFVLLSCLLGGGSGRACWRG